MIEGAELAGLPEDSESLKAVIRALLEERDRERRRAEEHARRAEEQKLRADQLHIEKLCLERELARKGTKSRRQRGQASGRVGSGRRLLDAR